MEDGEKEWRTLGQVGGYWEGGRLEACGRLDACESCWMVIFGLGGWWRDDVRVGRMVGGS